MADKHHFVYLAGPIAGLTYEQSTDWRNRFSEMMPSWVKCMSPMRAKAYLNDGNEILPEGYAHPLSSNDGITARDQFDVGRCDMMVANFLGAEKESLGTAVEFGWAKPPNGKQTPIVMIIEEDKFNPHHHAILLSLADFVVPTLELAAQAVVGVLTPDVEVSIDWMVNHGFNS